MILTNQSKRRGELLRPHIETSKRADLSEEDDLKLSQLQNVLLLLLAFCSLSNVASSTVPAGSPSRGGEVTVYVCDINQPSLPTPFYSVLVSISVFMAFSTVFHLINSPDNSPFSHSVLPVLSLP